MKSVILADSGCMRSCCSLIRIVTHLSCRRPRLEGVREREKRAVSRAGPGGGTHQLLVHPLGALGQELKVGVGVDVEDVDELGLEQGADVHPLLVHLLHSGDNFWLLIKLFFESKFLKSLQSCKSGK